MQIGIFAGHRFEDRLKKVITPAGGGHLDRMKTAYSHLSNLFHYSYLHMNLFTQLQIIRTTIERNKLE
jgi:hypothetical protein